MAGANEADSAVLLNDEVLTEANPPADQRSPRLLTIRARALPLRRVLVIVVSSISKLFSR